MSGIKLRQDNPKFCLTFGDSELGRIYEDDDGLLHFSGAVGASAEVFLTHLCAKYNARLIPAEALKEFKVPKDPTHPFDEWGFTKVLERFNLPVGELTVALNQHMDRWADTYVADSKKQRIAAYREVLCCALELSIRNKKEKTTDESLDKLIKMLKDSIGDDDDEE